MESNRRAHFKGTRLMLNFSGRGSVTTCDGVSRRDFLQVGTLGALGLSLAKFGQLNALAAEAKGQSIQDPGRSAILIFNLGAPSQLDLFDPKPGAPREIRGPFKPISTKGDFARSECLSYGGSGARYRPSNDANRASLHRWRQHAPRRLCAGISPRSPQ